MTSGIYSIERDSVDPVFFAVVPDAFMSRTSGARPGEAKPVPAVWSSEIGRPVPTPQDRWSF